MPSTRLPSLAWAVVRVGYIDLPNNIEIEKNGYCSGYAYEYLQALAASANWEFVYMPGNGEQLITSLRQGKVEVRHQRHHQIGLGAQPVLLQLTDQQRVAEADGGGVRRSAAIL